MATSSKKVAPVVISAPKIETAWKNLCTVTSKNDGLARQAIERLAKEIKASRLSIRDAQKVIRETKVESSLVKVSHIEGLPTWLELQKFGSFTAMDLDRQLSSAVASYKLLGSGAAENLESYEAVAKATKAARKVKNSKPKASTPKASKDKVASDLDVIKAFTAYVASLDFDALGDAENEALAMLQMTLEDKAAVTA